ncbi:MAG: glycosyltransferase family 4 protein [Bacteroidales bacterium]|nr:glycosyltransferase family 4 protein [Bacteroidales bacterium]
MQKVLFTTSILMHPPVGGPFLRIENTIKALNKISELHVISRVSVDNAGGQIAMNFYKNHSFKFLIIPSKLICKSYFFLLLRFFIICFLRSYNLFIKICLLKNINEFINTVSYADKTLQSQISDADFIIKYADINTIKIIWFGFGNISFDLMSEIKIKAPYLKLVCDTDSVWSRFILRELDVEKDAQRIKKIKEIGHAKEFEEREWMKFVDVTTAVSEVDAEYYRSIASDKTKVKLFSNVIDLSMYNKSQTPQPTNDFKKPCIYLAGTFGHYHSPMDTAARWVVDEILPVVRKVIPDIHFYIVGNNSDVSLSYIEDPGITKTGKLESVLPYLCHADVALVPLKFESGTRFKILEAGACEIPIVSTTLGAEGIPVTNNKDILIADTSLEFAEAIIKLIQNKVFAKEIALNCKKLIEKKYSIDCLVEEGKEILKYLAL